MQRMRFSLNISADRYLSYYQGAAKSVWVETEDGRSLKFPASELQRFVSHDGIHGRFEIIFDGQNKLVSLKRI